MKNQLSFTVKKKITLFFSLIFFSNIAFANYSKIDIAGKNLNKNKGKIARSILNAVEAGKRDLAIPFIKPEATKALIYFSKQIKDIPTYNKGVPPIVADTTSFSANRFYRIYYQRSSPYNIFRLKVEIIFSDKPFQYLVEDIIITEEKSVKDEDFSETYKKSVLYKIQCGNPPSGGLSLGMFVDLDTESIIRPVEKIYLRKGAEIWKLNGIEHSNGCDIHLNFHFPDAEILLNEKIWQSRGITHFELSCFEPKGLPKDFMNNFCLLERLESLKIMFHCYSKSEIRKGIPTHNDVIPECLNNLENFKTLKISQFDGEIPAYLGNLRQLENLEIAGNFKSIPSEIGNLNKLNHLSIQSDEAEKIPSNLCQLENLEILIFRMPLINSLPEDIGNLQKLKLLKLHNVDSIAVFPKSLSKIKSLKRIDLANTAMIPNALVELAYLDTLMVRRVRNIEHLGQYTGISFLNMTENEMIEFSENFSNLKKLEEAFIHKSEKLKLFPKEIEGLPNLKHLEITQTQLTEIPNFIFKSLNLEYLEISNSDINDISSEVSNLKNLNHLNLRNNLIETIPKEILELDSCQEIILKRNKINSIAPEILNYQGDKKLTISIRKNPLKKSDFTSNSVIRFN